MRSHLPFALALLAALPAFAGVEAGVAVYLEDGKGNIVLRATTDPRGAFSFQGVGRGEYVVRTSGRGTPATTRRVVLGGAGFQGTRGSVYGNLEFGGGAPTGLHAYCAPEEAVFTQRDRGRWRDRWGGADISLEDRRLRPGEEPLLHIHGGVPYAGRGQRYWVTVVRAGAPDSAWGLWQYLRPGEQEVHLQVPAGPGDYEVRVHDAYPRNSYRVLYRETFRVSGGGYRSHRGLRFDLQDHHLRRGEAAQVIFRHPLPAVPGQNYWITIAPEGSADSTWGTWQYLQPGAREVDLRRVGPGRYEVRLHDLYPRNSSGVLHRETLVVH